MTGRGGEGRRGVTLIELLIVVLIIGVLVGILVPHGQRAVLRARAVDAVAVLNTVNVAVLNYQADNGTWPPEPAQGEIPSGLEDYLPQGFDFSSDDYVVDFENWSQSVGLVGISLVTDDRDLGLQVLQTLGSNSWTNNSDKYTWVMEWTD